jgi:hypothetical protein
MAPWDQLAQMELQVRLRDQLDRKATSEILEIVAQQVL